MSDEEKTYRYQDFLRYEEEDVQEFTFGELTQGIEYPSRGPVPDASKKTPDTTTTAEPARFPFPLDPAARASTYEESMTKTERQAHAVRSLPFMQGMRRKPMTRFERFIRTLQYASNSDKKVRSK